MATFRLAATVLLAATVALAASGCSNKSTTPATAPPTFTVVMTDQDGRPLEGETNYVIRDRTAAGLELCRGKTVASQFDCHWPVSGKAHMAVYPAGGMYRRPGDLMVEVNRGATVRLNVHRYWDLN